jgi:hypothetical protein
MTSKIEEELQIAIRASVQAIVMPLHSTEHLFSVSVYAELEWEILKADYENT